MRTILVSLALLIPLAACWQAPDPSRGPSPDVPLGAYILPLGWGGGGDLSFVINRPAYVALFEIVPGRGIGLVYPNFRDGGRMAFAGMNRIWTGLGSHRWSYLPSFAGYAGYTAVTKPRFYYLVASDEPLRISDFVASPTALRSTLGWSHFAAWNPYDAAERLTDRILPLQPPEDWTTDLYVHWPEPPPAQRNVQALRLIACRNGGHIVVRWDAPTTSCPSDDRARPGEIERGDSAGVRKPTRRRPPVRVADRPQDAEPRARPGVTRIRPDQPEREPAVRKPPEPRQPPSKPRVRPETRGPRAEPRSPRTPRVERRPSRPARPSAPPRGERPSREPSNQEPRR